MVRLVAMRDSEFEQYMQRDIQTYAEENVKAGYWLPTTALEKSRKVHDALLPDGLATKDHHFFNIQDDERGEVIGTVWLKVDRDPSTQSGFIYELFIEEAFRRKGYATQAMLALQEKAKELGLRALVLHVFAHNRAAIALYAKLGYEIKSLNMTKDLT